MRKTGDPRPDEDRDVIVHYFRQIERPSNDASDRWTVWIGQEKQVEYAYRDQAVNHARQLAIKTGRQAWLLDEHGYPMKPIEIESSAMQDNDIVADLQPDGCYIIRRWHVSDGKLMPIGGHEGTMMRPRCIDA